MATVRERVGQSWRLWCCPARVGTGARWECTASVPSWGSKTESQAAHPGGEVGAGREANSLPLHTPPERGQVYSRGANSTPLPPPSLLPGRHGTSHLGDAAGMGVPAAVVVVAPGGRGTRQGARSPTASSCILPCPHGLCSRCATCGGGRLCSPLQPQQPPPPMHGIWYSGAAGWLRLTPTGQGISRMQLLGPGALVLWDPLQQGWGGGRSVGCGLRVRGPSEDGGGCELE